MEKHNIVFLEDDYERWVINVWSMSLRAGFSSYDIDPLIVFEYAKEYKHNKIELLELIKTIERSSRDGKQS